MNIHSFIRSQKKKKTVENEDFNEALNKYSGLSEEQLTAELFKKGSLSNGNVSAEELDAFYRNALPFLTKEQAEKMRSLITQLKNS
ncbi:MAG: hypothetical protein MR239_01890 [Clostridiales bacterium]|jgi:hypothetical protein|nr:hypothetical protein [Clostridiales bacterium]MDY4655171.1 hypothetical protein [Eubacteriales bacterium]